MIVPTTIKLRREAQEPVDIHDGYLFINRSGWSCNMQPGVPVQHGQPTLPAAGAN